MIIDFHTHIFESTWLPDKWWAWLTEYYNTRRDNSLLSKKSKDLIIDDLCDSDGRKLLSAMDHANIDKSIVLPLDWGIMMGEPPVMIEEQHRRIAEISKNSEGRLIPFVGVDPRRGNAVTLMKSFLEQYNMRGIKLYPAAGYDLRKDDFRFVFDIALEYEVPVMVHTGISFGPFASELCGPTVMDYLCASYPDVKFIAAHLGAGYLDELCWLGYAKPNLYADCSLMQVRARQNYQAFASSLRLALDLFGSRRILFGSDWPFSRSVMRNADYVKTFEKLLTADIGSIKFASFELKQMLGKNAESLLNRMGEGRNGN